MLNRSFLFCTLLAAFSGCATTEATIKLPTAGGEMIPIDFSRGSAVHAENKEVAIDNARFEPDLKTKQAAYVFGFHLKQGGTPRSVKIEDVTDDAAVVMVADEHPKIEAGRWTWRGEPFTIDFSNSRWLFEIDNSIRVYRFTIVTSDNRSLVMHEAFNYPPFVKTAIRQQLGLEPTPAAH